VASVAALAAALGLQAVGRLPSPITGRDGNQEYLLGFLRA
jgi:predicted rRNA methylase YqxC with S4 and FtsJ domains